MATPAPGTIPALPPYQPGALAITGQELLEIASSTNATTATSGYMLLVDVVGKAPSAMPTQTPSLSDLIACFSVSGGRGYNVALGNLVAQVTGNLPIGGGTGQILAKASGANFAAAWVNLSAQVTASTGISVGGSTTVAIALASAAGLSVLGVTGAAQADPAPIVGTAGQVLAVNAGGTGLAFMAATAVLPGPYQTGTLTAFGVVYGNGTSALGATAAGTTTWALLGNGTALAPSFQQINLGSATITGILPGGNYSAVNLAATGAGGVQGVLPGANMSAVNLAATGAGGIQNTLGVPHGGTGTALLTAFGVVYGNGTSTAGITAAGTAGLPLVGNGTAVAPGFAVLTVPGGGTGTAILTANAVLLGAGTGILQFAAATAAGNILIDQGASSNPVFRPISGDIVVSALGAATVTTGAITYGKIATAAISTTGDFVGNTASKVLDSVAVWNDAVPLPVADTTTYTPNLSNDLNYVLALGSVCSTTGTLANPAGTVKPGQSGGIVFTQDATGGRKIGTWGTQYKFTGGVKPIFTAAASAADTMFFWCKSATEIHCFFNPNMS